jgi:nucleotide-binding universal stress UspA family protein
MPCKILLPVDGSKCASHAAQHVAGLAAMVPELQVHLLNVQPPGDDWMVRRMLKPDELVTLEKEWGESAFAPVRDILKSAGLSATEHIEQGDVADAIARVARELGCDQIIMGSHGRTALGGFLLGSVVAKLLHLADQPVTLVK